MTLNPPWFLQKVTVQGLEGGKEGTATPAQMQQAASSKDGRFCASLYCEADMGKQQMLVRRKHGLRTAKPAERQWASSSSTDSCVTSGNFQPSDLFMNCFKRRGSTLDTKHWLNCSKMRLSRGFLGAASRVVTERFNFLAILGRRGPEATERGEGSSANSPLPANPSRPQTRASAGATEGSSRERSRLAASHPGLP